jgi:hypothetical protein
VINSAPVLTQVLFLTQWEGYEDPKHDTWEPLDNFARNNYVVYQYVAKQPSLKKFRPYFTISGSFHLGC